MKQFAKLTGNLLLGWLFCNLSMAWGQEVNAGLCIIENNQFRSELYYGHQRIENRVLLHKASGTNLLSADTVPYFSVVVNQQLITANLPIWKYKTHSMRQLVNGGTELKLQFEATRLVKGLVVTLYRQWFPGETLLRERLELSTNGAPMQLHKRNGRLHLEFPAYSFAHHAAPVAGGLHETRIASFAEELLPIGNPAATYDDRALDGTRTFNLAHCHMFHPRRIYHTLADNTTPLLKGPLAFWQSGRQHFFFSYEHASQDKAWQEAAPTLQKQAGLVNDEQQGSTTAADLPFADSTLHFIAMQAAWHPNHIAYRQAVLRGAYLHGEAFSAAKPYSTVWSAWGVANDRPQIDDLVHRYLWTYITEHPHSRQSHFYYNTWGMQRDNTNRVGLRDIFTESRILTEIKNAAELGVDLFVLDDGWEQKQGEWKPHTTRLPQGLAPLVAAMQAKKIIPGIWLSPMGIDSTAARYRTLQHLVIKDKFGQPIKAQWDHPAFDFVSSFKDSLVADCKWLIDQGIRFFKWDAINTFNSTVATAQHGTAAHSPEDIRDRYAYLLPFFVTDAMRELRRYHPEVVVEIDLTEKERCIIGLMPLQEGKLFWMNNGASAYNDYGYHRSKSMRTVINRFAGILPTELFTQAVYPHNSYPFFAQRYHVNTALAGGRGFWGNLNLMDSTQRLRVGETVRLSKRILPYVQHLPLRTYGSIGSMPEWYLHLDTASAAGQLMAFAGQAGHAPLSVYVPQKNSLGALRHAYRRQGDTIRLDITFVKPDDSREVFFLPNGGTGIGVESCTGWLADLILDTNTRTLSIVPGAGGELVLRFPKAIGTVLQAGKPLAPVPADAAYSYYKLPMQAQQPLQVYW